ncbi:AMP-dependent synthetase/ligase [Telmatobacter bradus]|uniref:AMP-dependent synthetase/ligase n=1 Tax=Telmatobacter bradus TaxID=474953 RepID=UPI003B42B6BE
MTKIAPFNTLNDLLARVVSRGNSRAVLWQDPFGNWLPISSDQFYQRVRSAANTFLSWGAQKGDRIALISENRWEWAVADFATMAFGGIVVPIYPTLTGEQIAALLADAGTKIALVSSRQQFDKLNSVRHLTVLERIVMMDAPAAKEAIAFSTLVEGADELGAQRDPEFDRMAASVTADDLCTLIYTSGTTGEPKGVALSHGNIASNQSIAANDFNIDENDACISFLPLSHITARALDYVMYARGAQVAYCSHFDKLPQAMREVRPTVFVGVPRVFEKIRQEVERRASCSGFKQKLLGWALRTGACHEQTVFDGKKPKAFFWQLANKLVYSKVREAFGGRVRIFVSGGAPLGVETAQWFASAGIALWEGYGLTETSPLIAINSPLSHKMGAAGLPMANLELLIAEDGELLVKGPSVFKRYWHQPTGESAAFDAEGWFHTGDIGHLDADGFLFITDRKKELLKTSGGKLVAPQPIENKLKAHVLVGQAALIGDKHKFVSVIISPNFAALEDWAKRHNVSFKSRAELVANPQVLGAYGEIVREVNATLANYESLKRFRVVADEWTQETGELTPSLKLKRRVLNSRYAELIVSVYEDEATARGGSAS